MEMWFLETMRQCRETIVADGRTKLNHPSINDKNNQYIIKHSNTGRFFVVPKIFNSRKFVVTIFIFSSFLSARNSLSGYGKK